MHNNLEKQGTGGNHAKPTKKKTNYYGNSFTGTGLNHGWLRWR